MKEVTYADCRERMELVVRYIHGHLDDPLSVAVLAEQASMSPFHFQRVFSRIAGERCGHMVRRLRLERAAWQLQNTDLRIADIALDAAFESQEAFARSFRSAFGSPATDFREHEWLSHHLLSANRAHFAPVGRPFFDPIARRNEGIPFSVQDIDSFSVFRRRHNAAPHLIEKSLRSFVSEVVPLGFDPRRHLSITYAEELGPNLPVQDIVTYVAVRVEDVVGPSDPETASLGGGPHLCVKFVGAGWDLGDFWFRVWAEALPASGRKSRPAPCFQCLRFGVDSDDPSVMEADLHIPVN